MLKFLLLVAALAVAVTGEDKTCKMTDGNLLHTFSGSTEPISMGCKFHAVRGTTCGKFRVLVTPGLRLVRSDDLPSSSVYVLEQMYIGVARVDNLLALEGRMSNLIAEQYLNGKHDNVFVKKDGYMNTSDVFIVSGDSTKREVTLREREGDFSITFGVFDGSDPSTSTFSFVCHSDTFTPTPYPRQLCGNGTVLDLSEDERSTITTRSVFSNMGIVQTDIDCIRAARLMSSRCKMSRREVAKICKPIMAQDEFVQCLAKPTHTFHKCVKFACSSYTDPNACYFLGQHLNHCPVLPEITPRVQGTCIPQ